LSSIPLTVAAAIAVFLRSKSYAGMQFPEHLLGEREVHGGQVRSLPAVTGDDRLG
jgi:hypothetical protein